MTDRQAQALCLRMAEASLSEATSTSRLGYRPALDGVRGLHFLIILVYHSSLYWWIEGIPLVVFVGGYLAVDSFFVLSGFLITTLLLEEWERNGTIKLSHFYMRRALRLLPALLAMLLVMGTYRYFSTNPNERIVIGNGMFGAFFYCANLMLTLGKDLGPFTHTWSLSLEEQFYVFWPTLVVLTLRRHWPRGLLVGVCVALIAATLVWRAMLWVHYHKGLGRMLYAPDTRFDSLLVGCLIGMIWSWRWVSNTPRIRKLGWWFACGGSLFVLWQYLRTDAPDPFLYAQGGFTWVAIGYAGLVWGLLEFPFKPLRYLFENRFIVWCGKTSYSLYLWHVPVIYFYKVKTGRWDAPIIIAAWLTVFLVSGTSYYALERPCLRLKRFFSSAENLPLTSR